MDRREGGGMGGLEGDGENGGVILIILHTNIARLSGPGLGNYLHVPSWPINR